MERKIGERFDYNGVTLEVVKESFGCLGCYFIHNMCVLYINNIGHCPSEYRSDNQSVIFREVKK